jgi:uncharacterized protein with HEPN domain
MASSSYNREDRAKAILSQILDAIKDLEEWNESVITADDYYCSPEGMKNLAASCMLLEAIGEGFKQVDKLTDGALLVLRPDIPWRDVIGIRNHIAHGYFDIDGEVVLNTVKNDLAPLRDATADLVKILSSRS